LIRSLLVTFSVAQFCRVFAGDLPVPALLVMTFAWASTIAGQLAEADHAGTVDSRLWSPDAAVGFLSGQLLWAAPLLRVLAPAHWFWLPVPTASALTAAAVVATVCCPLIPWWNKVVGRRPALVLSRDLDLAILCSSFFLLSGSLVFAVGAAASLTTVLASRLTLSSLAARHRRMSHTMSYGVLKTT
jgi:hypothetical protein